VKTLFRIERQAAGASALRLVGLISAMGFILACATTPPYTPLPPSHWNGSYAYNYDPPQQKPPASVRVNVIVVNPFYKEAESVFVDSMYAKVGKGFSKSMGVDLDKIIVSKGMTAVGPYSTLDDVTYPDKKNADITFAPRVFLTTETKFGDLVQQEYQGVGHWVKPFTMKISGWIAYEMREPLSGQKLWIKKLELEERQVSDVEIYEAVALRTDSYGNVLQWDQGKLKYSGREEALANALRDAYPTIMEKAWTYLNTEEILDLKEKTKEIRDRKVY
jgi:hypothetical protein